MTGWPITITTILVVFCVQTYVFYLLACARSKPEIERDYVQINTLELYSRLFLPCTLLPITVLFVGVEMTDVLDSDFVAAYAPHLGVLIGGITYAVLCGGGWLLGHILQRIRG